jgi:hypothetical protein
LSLTVVFVSGFCWFNLYQFRLRELAAAAGVGMRFIAGLKAGKPTRQMVKA